MGWVSGIIVYILIWWMVFFSILPFGNHPETTPEEGHAESAPAKPRIGLKMLATTGISIGLFGVAWWIIQSDLISFRTL